MKHQHLNKLTFLMSMAILVCLSGCAASKNLTPAVKSMNKDHVTMSYMVTNNSNVITVSTNDPIALRALVMQGFTLSVSGAYAYSVVVPSAQDVEGKVSRHPGEVGPTMQQQKPGMQPGGMQQRGSMQQQPGMLQSQDNDEKRPDMRPVLEALNKEDAVIYANSGSRVGKAKKFEAEIDPSTGTLTYRITLSGTFAMDLPVNVTLNSKPKGQADEFLSGNFQSRSDNARPQPFGVGQQQPDNGKKEILIKYSFGR